MQGLVLHLIVGIIVWNRVTGKYKATEGASESRKILPGTLLCPHSSAEDYRPPSSLLRSLHVCRAARGRVGTLRPARVAAV